MTEVVAYIVSLSNKDGEILYNSTLPVSISLITIDESNRVKLNVGASYVVTVQSVNSIGTSDTSSTLFGELHAFLYLRYLLHTMGGYHLENG